MLFSLLTFRFSNDYYPIQSNPIIKWKICCITINDNNNIEFMFPRTNFHLCEMRKKKKNIRINRGNGVMMKTKTPKSFTATATLSRITKWMGMKNEVWKWDLFSQKSKILERLNIVSKHDAVFLFNLYEWIAHRHET